MFKFNSFFFSDLLGPYLDPQIDFVDQPMGFPLDHATYSGNEATIDFSLFQTQPSGTTGRIGVYFDGELFGEEAGMTQNIVRTPKQVSSARLFIQTPNLYQDKNVLKVRQKN